MVDNIFFFFILVVFSWKNSRTTVRTRGKITYRAIFVDLVGCGIMRCIAERATETQHGENKTKMSTE